MATLRKQSALVTDEGQGTSLAYIAFNFSDPILAHRDVRQALAYATDRGFCSSNICSGGRRVSHRSSPAARRTTGPPSRTCGSTTTIRPAPGNCSMPRASVPAQTASVCASQSRHPQTNRRAFFPRRWPTSGNASAYNWNYARSNSPHFTPTSPTAASSSIPSVGWEPPIATRTFLEYRLRARKKSRLGGSQSRPLPQSQAGRVTRSAACGNGPGKEEGHPLRSPKNRGGGRTLREPVVHRQRRRPSEPGSREQKRDAPTGDYRLPHDPRFLATQGRARRTLQSCRDCCQSTVLRAGKVTRFAEILRWFWQRAFANNRPLIPVDTHDGGSENSAGVSGV